MVELRLPPVPADLKHVLPFLQRAQEVRLRDPIVCYWSLYYVARLGMQRGKTQDNQAFLAAVVDQLEGMKRSLKTRRQITDEAAGSLYVRRFGFNVFYAANNEDMQGQATRATAKKFLAASYFLEILRAFGPLDKEVDDTIKYAKFKAGDIVRALRDSITPTPAIPDVPGRTTPNGHALSPSTLSPQTNPILLSGRPSNFNSPAESPTTGAPRRGYPFPQPNYPPPPTDSGSGSAPVSPRNPSAPTRPPFFPDALRREVKPEQVALPASGSSGEIPLPEPASPRKLQSPIRSPLAPNGAVVSLNATPVNNVQPLPSIPKTASPAKVRQEIPVTSPVIQQSQLQWPLSNIILTRPEEWPRHALVSPAMSSTMTMDSTDTFTSSQLRTVIKSGSTVVRTGPRASSPVKTESVASTSQSGSQVTDSVTSEDESIAESTLMPVLTVMDNITLANKIEVATGVEDVQASNLVAVASPVVDDWGFGRGISEAIDRLTHTVLSPARSPNTETSPLSLARNTPIPESPDASLQATMSQTPAYPSMSLMTAGIQPGTLSATAGPTVVIPQSPAQPSPTTPNMISPYSPSTISPVSLDMAVAQNRSFRSAAELIDMELSKVYGKLDGSAQESDPNDAGLNDEEGIDVESGSSLSSFSSESESEADQPMEEERSAASSDEEDDGSSVVSEMTVMSAQVSVETKGQEVQHSGLELKSLIKTSGGSNGGTQTEAAVARKSVRFAPSVVGGLSPEIPKQILPPPMTTQSRSSPPLPIIPASAVSHSMQPLVRPKSLTIRPSFDNNQPSSMSPDSPLYTPAVPHRASGMVGYVSQPPPLIDGRPAEEFAIIPFHPSMSASHPPPSIHNNPAYAPAPNTSLMRTQWNASPPQVPSLPYRRQLSHTIDRETAALAQKYSRFAISSLNYMDIETAKKELRAALSLLEGETY